ncbi:hypothetical protein [Staphylococcus shinii]|nr:hypothetical protein [Staphylococcus shinii]MDW8568851.1 hypothetical protein [Staphylococcus shinii]
MSIIKILVRKIVRFSDFYFGLRKHTNSSLKSAITYKWFKTV